MLYVYVVLSIVPSAKKNKKAYVGTKKTDLAYWVFYFVAGEIGGSKRRLMWKIPWTEEPGRLLPTEAQELDMA